MSTTYEHLIGSGIYGVGEAARLSGVPSARIRRWLCGYKYVTAKGETSGAAIFAHQLPKIEGEIALSFLDLIEIKVVSSLRDQKISWKAIRNAERHASELFATDHPFATRRFKTDGRSIFASIKKKGGERALIDLADNQFTFRKFVEPHLKDLDFDTDEKASRWWPMGAKRRVVVDPQRNFGQPIVREGVPTGILSLAFKREKSAQVVARWYDVEVKAVKDAVEFEQTLAA